MRDNTAFSALFGGSLAVVLLLAAALAGPEGKKTATCLNAGLEWLDAGRVRGDGE